MIRMIEQFFCGVRGHELIKKAKSGHLCTECIRCGYKSPGIQTGSMKVAA